MKSLFYAIVGITIFLNLLIFSIDYLPRLIDLKNKNVFVILNYSIFWVVINASIVFFFLEKAEIDKELEC